ncbi:MarR family winged helix-turn-helix transcriptional regulator [Kitasatospora sp. NPDC057015]|uniref:MarR family winged helix-turn-helix transcriptional regulator n=1 Tax=Kitasatospora sp. NPDC057015 TaxID=3346001 RepID=UPI00364174F2
MTRTTPTPAPADPSAPGTDRLMDHLAHAAACYYRSFAVVAAGQGLTLIQGKMLSLLGRPLPMRALAELLGCDASNVTGIVDRLEARGLVRRAADPADRRVKTVLLTPEGEEAVRRIRADIVAGLPGLTRLDADDRRALQALLDRAFPHTPDPSDARTDGTRTDGPHPSG